VCEGAHSRPMTAFAAQRIKPRPSAQAASFGSVVERAHAIAPQKGQLRSRCIERLSAAERDRPRPRRNGDSVVVRLRRGEARRLRPDGNASRASAAAVAACCSARGATGRRHALGRSLCRSASRFRRPRRHLATLCPSSSPTLPTPTLTARPAHRGGARRARRERQVGATHVTWCRCDETTAITCVSRWSTSTGAWTDRGRKVVR